MRKISQRQVEWLNAHGPYNHAVWGSGAATLTQEESLAGRARFLAATLRRVLTKRFRRTQLAKMSIVDVGCYDGWLLHQLSDLPFHRMVGVEPREKNIRKGEAARSVFGVRTRVEFRLGDIESLADCTRDGPFDIVVSTGLLHHVESPCTALRSLRRVCHKLLFLESIVLDSGHLTPAARREIEPKDVVYYGRTKAAGLSANKLESAYYDGSATGLRVVNIPSLETLAMCCEASGFSPPRLEADPKAYRRAVWRGRRPFHAAILTAEPRDEAADEHGIVHGQRYERQLASAILPREDIEPLWQRHCAGTGRVIHTDTSRAAADLIARRRIRQAGAQLEERLATEAHREILRSFPHAPADKIAVEMGKLLLAEGHLDEAEAEFRGVTGRWNADWRSVYRSFHYLAQIAHLRGDKAMEKRYRELLAIANPHFPGDAWPISGKTGTEARNRRHQAVLPYTPQKRPIGGSR